jgi:hypothetical protein
MSMTSVGSCEGAFSHGIENLCDAYLPGHGDRTPRAVALPVAITSHFVGDNTGNSAASGSGFVADTGDRNGADSYNGTGYVADSYNGLQHGTAPGTGTNSGTASGTSSVKGDNSSDCDSISALHDWVDTHAIVKHALRTMWTTLVAKGQPYTAESMRRKWPTLWTSFVTDRDLASDLTVRLRS